MNTTNPHIAHALAAKRLRLAIQCLCDGLPYDGVRDAINDALKLTARSAVDWALLGDHVTDNIKAKIGIEHQHKQWISGHAELLAKAYVNLKTMRHGRKSGRKYKTIQSTIADVKDEAQRLAFETLKTPTAIEVRYRQMKTGPRKCHLIGPMWKHKTDACGGGSIGNRFILNADLVDQIGEYDLYEIQYLSNGEKSDTVQHGYLARFRGTSIRGFGAKPETALSWTRRQVVMRGTKALTK